MDILLDATTHDIVFDNSDTPSVTTDVRQDVAQRLKIKLSTYLGEWFLDMENGIPFYQRVFQKGVTKEIVDAIFQASIMEEEDVDSITFWESTFNQASREYSCSFRVKARDIETNTVTVNV